MALDKLVDSTQLDNNLTSVANAIRAKSGGTGQLAFPADFVSEIGNIPTGGGGVTPTGTKQITITENGTTTEDVTNYASAEIAVSVSGGTPIYMSQYTTNGDVTIKSFLDNINYAVHSDTCLIIIRSNGTSAPTSGSYTLNNIMAVFNGGTFMHGADYYASGKQVPKTMANFPQSSESSTLFSLENGLLKNSYTGSSCIAGANAVVALVEIDLPNNFWDVLTAETIL